VRLTSPFEAELFRHHFVHRFELGIVPSDFEKLAPSDFLLEFTVVVFNGDVDIIGILIRRLTQALPRQAALLATGAKVLESQ
jgi:hypothetical protein